MNVVTLVEGTNVVRTDEYSSVVLEPLEAATIVVTGGIGPRGLPGRDAQAYSLVSNNTLGGQRFLYVNSLGTLSYASNDLADSANSILGFSTQSVVPGGSVSLINNQEVTESSWSWVPNLPIYLAQNGLFTQTPPSQSTGALFSLIVAFPVSATKIFIRLGSPIFLQ